jgi:hypothetical protein
MTVSSFAVSMETTKLVTKSFHVSCSSDAVTPGRDYVGILLLRFDGSADWVLNGIHCKTGYIYIKASTALLDIGKGAASGAHDKAYYSLFHCLPGDSDKVVIGSGFFIKNGKFVFETDSQKGMKMNDGFHDSAKSVGDAERICILETFDQWMKTGKQNWSVGDLLRTESDESEFVDANDLQAFTKLLQENVQVRFNN